MKLKKLVLIIAVFFLAIMTFNSSFNIVKAADGDLNLKIKMLRKSGYGYQLANSNKNVWKIYNTEKDLGDTIYCLKGGPGFGSENLFLATPTEQHYTKYFDMKNPSTIPQQYIDKLPEVNSKEYMALMWILDNIYVPAKTNSSDASQLQATQNRQMLLNSAKEYAKKEGDVDISGYEFEYLTDDDIDAVQQLAIWHYTNPSGDEYHVKDTFEFWLNAVPNENSNYQSLSSSDNFFKNGRDRAEACQALFNYLVEIPSEPDFSYNYANNLKESPISLENTTPTLEVKGERYIIGPYKMKELRNIDYTLGLTVTDGKEALISDVKILNSTKTEVTALKDLVNKESDDKVFYISIPNTTEDITTVNVKVSGTFFITTANYWSVEEPKNTDQPVVIVEKEPVNFAVEKEFVKEPDKIFDLALRKFITEINDVAPTVDRTPKISEEEIANLKTETAKWDAGTTAEKVHTKDLLTVRKGYKVVYTIRVYNEGNVAGYAEQITDYLPEGLKFVPTSESQINTTYGWTNPLNDGKTIVTNYLSNKKLDAFDGNTLDYEDLKIECEVIATSKTQSLKNVAEITIYKDESGNTSIKDRDSEAGNVDWPYGTKSQQDDDDFEDLILKEENFDLALRKFITSINGVDIKNEGENEFAREPKISQEEVGKLASGIATWDDGTTAEKVHAKDPLKVQTGDKIVYTIRVYNEGNISGYAKQITDYLPNGLAFIDPKDSTINTEYKWSNPSKDGKTIVSNYLEDTLLEAFDGTEIKYKDLKIECEVTATVTDKDQSLRNIAEITETLDEDKKPVVDRDSIPSNVDRDNYLDENQQDDDDFERLVMIGKYFDLSLRKFITSVQSGEKVKEYDRTPNVIVTDLANGVKTTAIYEHTKEPIGVSNGNIVTYTIRVYNEGQIDGYVTEITDHLPQELEFIVNDELNVKNGWILSDDGRTIKTDITSPSTNKEATRDSMYAERVEGEDKVLLKAFDGEKLDYIDVQVRCKVKEDISIYTKITNIAEITGFEDVEHNPETVDRDSTEDSLTNNNSKPEDKVQNDNLPTDEELPNYKDTEIEAGKKYIEGQQDDDDFEKLILQRFDLALRKFITKVNDTDIINRVPVFTKLSETEFKYEHPKDPVQVANGNIVTYTLRIFNEGNMAGYASKIKDDLPEGLTFLPDHETNVEYGWKMYTEEDIETDNVEEAKYIETDYLAKENEKEENANLLKAFDQETMTMPDYKDVKIAFKVSEPNTSDRIIINIAEITDDRDENNDPVEDVDSTPDNDEPDEDDIDEEKIKVQYFDLSLKKWVSESIVTYGGKTTVTKTGHTGDENPEPPAKVEIRGSRIDKTTVKFKFVIKVTNEGEIAGYAKELIDYIPEGLRFDPKDNPLWREEDGKVLTDQLKDTLLQPGESAQVEIILTWINNKNNLGEKVNWAEIYKDNNDPHSPDIDSEPGNNKPGEDDIDDAPVILGVVTGSVPTYVGLILVVVSILAGGVVLIKKFVI